MTTERDRRNQLRFAVDNAREEGLAAGLEEGEAKGRKEGAVEIAQKMLADGLDISVVSKYSGLSEAEIKAL